MAETPLLDGTSLVDWAQGKTEWTLEERRAVADQLAMSPTDAAASLRWVGWSRHGRRGGWGWTVEDRYVASVNPSANLSEFVMLGPASSLYDQVVLTDGTFVGVDTLTNEQFGMVETGLRGGQPVGPRTSGRQVLWLSSMCGLMALDSASNCWTPRRCPCLQERLSGICGGQGITRSIWRNEWAFAAFNRGFGAELVAPDATLGSALRPAGFDSLLDLAARVDVAGLWFASVAIMDIEAWIGRANATA